MAFTFPTTGTVFLTWVPAYSSGDIAAADLAIVALNNAVTDLFGLGAGATTQIKSTDGTTSNVATMPAWTAYDAIDMAIDWDSGTSLMGLHYCNKSNGDAWTHVTKLAFDGSFTVGSFLQLLKAAGNNLSIFRNIPIVFDQVFSDAEIEGMTL